MVGNEEITTHQITISVMMNSKEEFTSRDFPWIVLVGSEGVNEKFLPDRTLTPNRHH
jgi:hypothetical protein